MTQHQAVLLPPTPAAIGRAGRLLRDGQLVVFPTETVYGLGADASSVAALERLYAAKARPAINPVIVHVADMEDARTIAQFDEGALQLGAAFWPGPLTLVLPRRSDSPVSPRASAGRPSVAVRVPGNAVARQVIQAAGRPIAAASANISGAVSATTPQHVAETLGTRVALILAAGRSPVGVESTVIDLTRTPARLLRPGAVTREDVEGVIGPLLVPSAPSERDAEAVAPRSPGQFSRHYAPHLPVRLNALEAGAKEGLLTFGPDDLVRGGADRVNLSPGGSLDEAAANLYAMLRLLDRPDRDGIAVVPIPETGLGAAINDRLRRAAAPLEEAGRPVAAGADRISLDARGASDGERDGSARKDRGAEHDRC